jgi:hypothetical protein
MITSKSGCGWLDEAPTPMMRDVTIERLRGVANAIQHDLLYTYSLIKPTDWTHHAAASSLGYLRQNCIERGGEVERKIRRLNEDVRV